MDENSFTSGSGSQKQEGAVESNDNTNIGRKRRRRDGFRRRRSIVLQRNLRKQFCSPLISIGQFHDNYCSVLQEEDLQRTPTDIDVKEMATAMKLPTEVIEELSMVCSVNQLKCPAEMEVSLEDASTSQMPNGVEFHIAKDYEVQKKKRSLNINYLTDKKQPAYPCCSNTESDIALGEVVLLVSIYHPIKIIKNQEYLVLGSQYLNELRDSIECFTDELVTTEFSENPSLYSTESRARNVCQSAFFFIENVFYNDLRNPLCTDYSKNIIEWARTNEDWVEAGCGNLSTKSMDAVQFRNLKIRLGYPYLYCHQGDCEHIMFFEDLRLLSEGDSQKRIMYPVSKFKDRPRRQKCRVCDMFTARWITYNDRLAAEDPSFFCDKCFHALHYKEDGSKMCDFEAYVFMDDYV